MCFTQICKAAITNATASQWVVNRRLKFLAVVFRAITIKAALGRQARAKAEKILAAKTTGRLKRVFTSMKETCAREIKIKTEEQLIRANKKTSSVRKVFESLRLFCRHRLRLRIAMKRVQVKRNKISKRIAFSRLLSAFKRLR